jgi:hypothetical protein
MTNPAKPVSCLACGRKTSTVGLSAHKCFGVRGHEDIQEYWTRKRYSSQCRKIPFLLTGEEMVSLFEQAGITPADVGTNSPNQWVLARHGDTGPYEIGNCEFITHSDNATDGTNKRWHMPL